MSCSPSEPDSRASQVGLTHLGYSGTWKALPKRTRSLILVLMVLACVYGYTQVDMVVSAGRLEQRARTEIESVHGADNDVACETLISRPLILLGAAHGKVNVYVRSKDSGAIHEVSFYYVQQGKEWKLDGTGASASEESHQKGLKVFARRNPAALKG